jgi:3-phenylpropionate/trans-cinnamate dioxygenase ferredoxin reductase subunit
MEKNVTYLLVGGGLTSASAAGEIRKRDDSGSILIVGWEPHRPYDRPPFSKGFLTDDAMKPEDAASKPDEFYAENRVDVLTGTQVTRIDRGAKTATLDNGDTVRYEKLLIATGARPNPLNVDGMDLEGVHLLRTANDSSTIREALKNSKKAVMVGAGFIGMEVGAFATDRGVDVTVIGRSDQPWSQIHPSDEFARFLTDYYSGKGVAFLMGEEAAGFEGEGKLEAVRTKSDQRLEADLAVVAVGVTLNTELAKDAGLEVDAKQGIKVNEFLQTSDPAIWAAGDVACFNDVATGRQWHIEHYMNAMWQGEAVGAIMAGEQKPFDQVPYFFSDIFDLSMILRGEPGENRQTRVLGDMSSAEFVELYGDESGRLKMGIAFSRDYDTLEPKAEKLEAMIREGAQISSAQASDFSL